MISKRIFLWELPIADIFALRKILSYYSSLGVRVPIRHAYYGLIERWVGYLPLGFLVCWLWGFLITLLLILTLLATVGLVELYLMSRGIWPWRYFQKKHRKSVKKIFILEGYNAVGYFLLGAALRLLILT